MPLSQRSPNLLDQFLAARQERGQLADGFLDLAVGDTYLRLGRTLGHTQRHAPGGQTTDCRTFNDISNLAA
jgi:hypothetical protein